jgi:hypothetical protein
VFERRKNRLKIKKMSREEKGEGLNDASAEEDF